MTTIVVVQKNQSIVIAADTQTTFGDDQKLLADMDPFCQKIFEHAGTLFAISGSAAHDLVLQQALRQIRIKDFSSRSMIFETFRRLHPRFKEQFFLKTEEDAHDPYESTQMMILMANVHGIFAFYPLREVYQFSKFWAIGSGRKFAMGAMHALYQDTRTTAEDIARAGIEAGAAFDAHSSLPMHIHSLKLEHHE
jgi:ATP-dependent HslUV protease subunit HslV